MTNKVGNEQTKLGMTNKVGNDKQVGNDTNKLGMTTMVKGQQRKWERRGRNQGRVVDIR
jgi:hypothetical protein